ncbi:MAG TPA: bifunctional phosphopantothenoylcysteine decarboxylase/phosphopantothenate--cysteine ligase CoaBC [Solirubrobacteraceae bacterium]|nr:bifunctional phosphopantothenoylcysteine decarboxylase/phosphopantothenate--cysteine ligase CoaBC [Solirubrobacteraceae bacterium]
MARLLLGVSGGIAAYKALELVRLATKAGHAVRVVQTPASRRFVGSASFAAVSGAPVLVSEFERDPARGAFPDQPSPDHDPLSHLELVRSADAYLIAPASANTLAKLAGGHADNLLTSAALAATCPVLVAPAMNDQMYRHPATRANLALLAERGIGVLEPDSGALGSRGEWGIGRLQEPERLLAAFEAVVPAGGGPLDGLRVLITAGGTREPIDEVRFVGNRSSGRMGYALADEAARRGADVTVVAANVGLPRNPAVRYVDVRTADELAGACRDRFPHCQVLLMAAAVADYRPRLPAAGKLRKEAAESLTLNLERTEDVLGGLAAGRRSGQTVVGFAAEHGPDAVESARRKRARKGLDAVVVNDISRADIGFEGADNEVTIVTGSGERHVPRAGKAQVAATVLDEVVRLRDEARDGTAGADRAR